MKIAMNAIILIIMVLTSVLPMACGSSSKPDIEGAENCLEDFFMAAKANNPNEAWSLCYEPAFDNKSLMTSYIQDNYQTFFRLYTHFVINKSKVGNLKMPSLPQLHDMTCAEIKGYVYLTNSDKYDLTAIIVNDNGSWEVALVTFE